MADRLISAEYLIAEANKEGAYGYVDAYQIANAPEGVVRCKDCKWYYQLWIDAGIMREHCHRIRGMVVKADGYCAWGERREDGSEAHEG